MNEALILVDIQNDFLPGGSLAVPDGDQILPFVNSMIDQFDLVIATQDWHPQNHQSFASNHDGTKMGSLIELDGLEQILWPDHCVQNTVGAEFSSELNATKIDHVVQKGTDPMVDSYSGFFDNARRRQTELDSLLRREHVDRLHLVGLATDYCVKFTALDSVDLGFDTIVYPAGIRAVDLSPGDGGRALSEMESAGVQFGEKI